MKKYIPLILFLIIILLPSLVFGQTTSTGDSQKLLQFLKGDGAFEKWFMEVFTRLDTTVAQDANQVSLIGRSIGGLGMIIHLGYMGIQMSAGDREWETGPMLRPIIIGFILLNWVSFTQMIQYPLQKLAEPSISIFEDIEKESNNLRIKKYEIQNQLFDYLIKAKSEEEAKQETMQQAQENTDESWIDSGIEDGFDKILTPIKEWGYRMNFELQKLVADIIEAIGLTILRVCVYLIFFIQKIWSYVLIILGPIAVGMAIVPGFEGSFGNWVSKFININLYTFISYIIINIGQQLIMVGYTMEIERYELLIKDGVADQALILTYISGNGMIYTVLFTCVAYVITGIGVLMTPTIADSIVSAGGSSVMTKMKQAAGTMGSSGKIIRSVASSAGGRVGNIGKAMGTGLAQSVQNGKSAINTMRNK